MRTLWLHCWWVLGILKFPNFQFPDLHLLDVHFWSQIRIVWFSNSKTSPILQFSNYNFENKKLGTHTFRQFQIFWFSGMKNMSQGRSHELACIFQNIFGDRYGIRGSRIGRCFEGSRNHPKKIAIDQESLIGHLEITTPPQKKENIIILKTKKSNKRIVACHIWDSIRPRFGPYFTCL